MGNTKLVRDHIPELIRSQGGDPKTYIATQGEYEEKLLAKLREELEEFIEARSIEELADLCEVVAAVQQLYGWTDETLRQVQDAKREERGAFERRIILEKS